jgi:hypothetical protein
VSTAEATYDAARPAARRAWIGALVFGSALVAVGVASEGLDAVNPGAAIGVFLGMTVGIVQDCGRMRRAQPLLEARITRDVRVEALASVAMAGAAAAGWIFVGAKWPGTLGACSLGAALAFWCRWGWLVEFEARTPYTVIRRRGFRRGRGYALLLAQKDTAVTGRNPPHAQPEASRRAP